jgi:hypothetical protein
MLGPGKHRHLHSHMPVRSRRAAATALGISVLLVCVFLQDGLAAQLKPFERAVATFNKNEPPAYRAFRRLEAGLVGSDKHGWLEAWTEFQPGKRFTFEVVREGGSEYVRNKVLRNLLKNEQELLADGKPLRQSLDDRNYTFEDGGATPAGLQRIILKPARKSVGIVNGSVLIHPTDGVVAMDGRLVKSPSFWVRDVDVTWKFATIAGYVVPIEMSTDGRVRFFGKSSFKMTYQYVSIDGQPTGNAVATVAREQQHKNERQNN